jgi:hypothetical protein
MIEDQVRATNDGRRARLAAAPAVLVLALAAGAVGCGSSAADHLQDARQALADASYSDVVAIADGGLRAEPEPKTAWALELVKLEALARSGQGEAAIAQLEGLAAAHPERLGPTQYSATADQLRGAGDAAAAIRALDLGAKQHPGDAMIAKLISDSASSADVDPAELEMLRSLGYVQ